jgi:hypothetical protein
MIVPLEGSPIIVLFGDTFDMSMRVCKPKELLDTQNVSPITATPNMIGIIKKTTGFVFFPLLIFSVMQI